MIIATSPSAKRSRCDSSIGRLRPDALKMHDAADAADQAQRDEQRPVQMQREQQPRPYP